LKPSAGTDNTAAGYGSSEPPERGRGGRGVIHQVHQATFRAPAVRTTRGSSRPSAPARQSACAPPAACGVPSASASGSTVLPPTSSAVASPDHLHLVLTGQMLSCHSTMLQPLGALLLIAPPDPLRLPVTQAEDRRSVNQCPECAQLAGFQVTPRGLAPLIRNP